MDKLDGYTEVDILNTTDSGKTKVFIAKDGSNYYIRPGFGIIKGIRSDFSYSEPNIYIGTGRISYVKANILCSGIKRIKATKLAKKMYPNLVEENGWLTNYYELRCENG